MIHSHRAAYAAALLCAQILSAYPALAGASDYRFELAGKPQVKAGANLVQVRLVHVPDGKPVADAVIFETSADMGPAGMAVMTVPVQTIKAKSGLYSFEVKPTMTGPWALHLAAKVQGEAETVRGTITAELVK